MDEWTKLLLKGFGNLMLETREELGLTQRQAAKLTGSTQARLSDLENGKADVKISTLQRWARAYGYELEIAFVQVDEDQGENCES